MTPAPPRRPLDAAQALALVVARSARSAILVEGWSDAAAVETWALRCGIDPAANGIVLLPTGGITNFGIFAARLRGARPGLRLSGLYDASEERLALRGLRQGLLELDPTRTAAEQAGFFACVTDLEDELIRAVGTGEVERLLQAQDDHASFVRFRKQPAQRGRDLHPLLKRFLGTRAGRKERYGALLVSALAPDRVPAPLRQVLEHALA